eukprot:CAMPEP_0117647810 /NCGR_PEP_ID=MMETSP0804-20121206/47_1 /TAXON_ID=1074897 /ORGANISM="Tetraselmis astigmatica, Strain CCMP880" /LENGTH=153 /DNA_ID=CAMNT_0005453325 /DNA_START=113 /DNA_END=575 /DNA_ORIENTATION=+
MSRESPTAPCSDSHKPPRPQSGVETARLVQAQSQPQTSQQHGATLMYRSTSTLYRGGSIEVVLSRSKFIPSACDWLDADIVLTDEPQTGVLSTYPYASCDSAAKDVTGGSALSPDEFSRAAGSQRRLLAARAPKPLPPWIHRPRSKPSTGEKA